MKNSLLAGITICILVLCTVNEVRATHIMGADLTYTCIGPGKYEIHLDLYRDCNGILPDNSYTVKYSSAQCGVSSNVTVTSDGPPTDITPVCQQQTSDACNGAGAYGVQRWAYTGIITLPVGCGNDWTLSWTQCCRNGAITDLTNPLNDNIYIGDCLDNTQNPCVSSPTFLNYPIPFFCVDDPVNYNHGVVDIDGDSLVFNEACPLNSAGTPVVYSAGYSCAQPFATTAGGAYTLNSSNGNINFTPSQIQIGVSAITVDAYRYVNGVPVLVSCVTRDMQWTIIQCSEIPPTATGFNGGSSDTTFYMTLRSCVDTCVKIYSFDSGGVNVTMHWDSGIAGATFTSAGSPDPIGTFCWAPTPADTGLHYFTVTVANDDCPLVQSNTYSYIVRVTPTAAPGIVAGPDTTICSGQSVNVGVNVLGVGATGYQWSDGTNSWTTQNFTVTPTVTTQYQVTVTFANGCARTGSCLVTVDPKPVVSIYPTNISVCAASPVNLVASTTAANPTYYWNPTTNLSCTNCPNPVATPSANTQYCVSITDGHNCPSNTVCSQINFSSPPPPQSCAVIYATTNGTGNGTQANPTSLTGAIAMAQCNNGIIKLGTGTYTIDSTISNVTSYTTIEGGFNPVTWVKTSQAGATVILRSAVNPQGPANAPFIAAFYLNTQSYFRFQDLTIETQGCPASTTGAGWTNYCIYMANCSNYEFVRCQIIPGAGGAGFGGPAGAAGANGNAGANGTNGSTTTQVTSLGGDGGAGAGTLPGGLGAGASADGGTGAVGGSSTNVQSGGGGGGGGAGGYSAQAGGAGGNGGGINGGGGGPAGGAGGAEGIVNAAGSGANGTVGTAGTAGTAGAAGAAGTFVGGFYIPGNGGNGGNGNGGQGGSGGGGGGGYDVGVVLGTGDGGGGGGGGGAGGGGGIGGYGGGASIGVYCYNGGAAGVFTNDDIFLGTGGLGGGGGAGGAGGTGGNGGTGATLGDTEVGAGGNGGPGGTGGNGGPGGSGSTGSALLIYVDGGTPPSEDIAFNLAGQPVITASNVSCTNFPVTFTGPTASSWDVDTTSNPETGTGTSFTSTYTSAGRKNIVFAGDSFIGFFNVPINATNFIPGINTTAHLVHADTFILCRGQSANFNAVIASADSFSWNFGGAVNPNTYLGPQYQNINGLVFNTAGFFKITLQISTSCCGWSALDSIYLIVDSLPDVQISGLPAFCPGGSTTLTASGADYYSWSPATGLDTTAGSVVIASPQLTTSYLVLGLSEHGYCKEDTTFTVTVSTPPTVTFTTVDATCGSNGSMTAIPNPAGNYTYHWNDPNNSVTATVPSVPVGVYQVTVTNATSNCSVTGSAVVSQGAGVQAYIDSTANPPCFGNCTGYARVEAIDSSTNGPFNYKWSTNATTQAVSGLCAGAYTVTVTNPATACTATATAQIQTPPQLTVAVIDSVNPPCPFVRTGSIFVDGVGGTGPYTFVWSDPNHQDSDVVVNIAAGTYTVTATDANGCTAVRSVTLTAPASFTADTLNVISPSCFGGTNGSITITVTGGSPPFSYSWPLIPTDTDSIASGIPAGTYSVIIHDTSACADTMTNIVVTQPTALSPSVVFDTISCFGLTDAQATASATGGTPPYAYSLNGGAPQLSGTFTNLGPGTDVITITDSHLCDTTITFVIYQPPVLQVSLAGTVDDVCFNGTTGTATVTITGGTPAYTGVLGGQTITSAPYTFTNLAAGTYTINVTDAHNCPASTTATINQPAQLTLSGTSTPVSCFGGSNGTITANAGGGTGAYTYSLDGGAAQASPTFTGLFAGNHTLAVFDANNCTISIQVNVITPPQTTFITPTIVNVACNGQNNGSISLNIVVNPAPYTLTWAGGGGAANPYTGLVAGNYALTVLDGNSCPTDTSFTVTQPTAIIDGQMHTPVSCFGGANGDITLTVSGGTPAYTYAWSDNTTGPNDNNIAAGTYNVTITDSHGCQDSIQNIVITQPTLLTATATVTPDSCPGYSDGTMTAVPNGGTPNYTYLWSNGGPNIATDPALPKGTYVVTVTDANGCTATATNTIIELPGIIYTANAHNVFCVPLQNGFIQISATSSNNPVNYLWSNGSVAPAIYNLAPGIYSVTMTDAIGCPHDTSFTIINDSAFSITAFPHDTTVELGSSAGIRIIPNGDNISFMYWDPNEYILCDTCPATSAEPIQTMYYTAIVTSDSGCTAVDSILITVIPFYNIYVPNAFTPNGDGNNDYFSVYGEKEDWKEFSIKVFDRWGEKVFESGDENFQWDGKYKGRLMDPQVFVWEIHLTYLNNHTDKLYKGSVTLIR